MAHHANRAMARLTLPEAEGDGVHGLGRRGSMAVVSWLPGVQLRYPWSRSSGQRGGLACAEIGQSEQVGAGVQVADEELGQKLWLEVHCRRGPGG